MRNKSTPAKKELPIQTLNKIQWLFSEKGWPIDGDWDECYFNNFCDMMRDLSEDQQEMLLTLSQDFLWVQEMEYMKYFRAAFDLFISRLSPDERRTIIIAPLLPPEDFGKSKSSVALIYLIKCSLRHLQAKYSMHNLFLLENPSVFESSSFPPDPLLCLVDDFIGSGETASSAIKYFLDKEIPLEQLTVLGLVALQQGIDYLTQNHIQVFSSVIMQKAISGRTDGKEELYRELMQAIEQRIKVREDCTFGYAHSEGLVKMARTPNNTFPIYWLKNKKNPSAPFPR